MAPLPPTTPKVIVGTNVAPPFAIRRSDGSWDGITIELWREVAHALKLDYELREMSFPELVQAITRGTIDVAASALTITAEREALFDFTHSFYTSGLGVAVRYSAKDDSWWAVLPRLFSADFLKLILGLLGAALVAGALIWLAERRRNPDQFSGSPLRGVGAGLWWSAVTMTSVGYGDKVPQTVLGRAIAMIWMFLSVILLAAFTGSISSVLTLQQLETHVRGAEDLQQLKTATVDGTAAASYLRLQGVPARGYPTLRGALDGLVKKEAAAVVFDAPILRYFAAHEYLHRVKLQPVTIGRQEYGIALKNRSGLRESINRVILETIVRGSWTESVSRYFGQQSSQPADAALTGEAGL